MSLKKYLVVAFCLANSFGGLAIAADDSQIKNKHKKAKHAASKKPQATQKTATTTQPSTPTISTDYSKAPIQIGPYLNKDRLFDGSELIINVPTIREAARLLRQQYDVVQDCLKYGIPLPTYPRLTLSGMVEAQAMYINPYTAGNYTRFNLDSTELDFFLQPTSWLSGYGAIDYDPSLSTGNVFVNRGFATLGNLNVLPLYVSVGKMFVPFGRYASSMVTEPYTRDIGRTRVDAVEFGFQQPGDNAAHAEVYLYQSLDRYLSNGQANHLEYGTETGYQFNIENWSGEVGVGAISNIGDSAGIYSSVFQDPNNLLVHSVPAVDVYGSISYKKLSLLGEYLTAVRHFAESNFSFNNQGAQPAGFNTELAYAITSFNRPSSVGVGYSQTYQSIALNLPQHSYRAVYNINIVRNTNLAFEYRHDTNYPVSEGGTADASNVNLGKSDDAVTAQFDYYF